ncbi:N-lysine methyltransferase setd6-like [Anneissia japonica]|uniref:N-lysine methyltransferase setd6-like n=1 Tax=Anneissia japonica TaxID=1529436 RepID=UPI00142575D9|nr:N-lysine methyltransferase setd6-like [Anneissia japonica]
MMVSLPKKQRLLSESCLESFLSWCEKNEFRMNRKVEVRAKGSVAEYGMIAIDGLAPGEELFRIPRSVIICPQTSAVSKTLEQNQDKLKSDSGWVPLLITLMYEYTNMDSVWRSYLDLCIDHHTFNLPMFWSPDELKKLRGTGIPEAVTRDLKNIEKEYSAIVLPFMTEYPNLFSEKYHTLDIYKKMVAFVMSYSFTEPSNDVDDDSVSPPPIMVPMADMLNHVSMNNACLKFGKESLQMVTTQAIPAGEEVYNTYGELSNWHLLHMYGFAEKPLDNLFDVVEFTSTELFEQARLMKDLKIELLDDKVALLGKEDTFVVGDEGVLTEDELYSTLKVLFMSVDEFMVHKENEGWTSDDDDGNDINLTFDHLKDLPLPWTNLLASVARQSLKRYYREDEESVDRKNSNILCAALYADYVKDGQIKILQKMLDFLNVIH